jgi:hypothetical protein
MAFVAAGFILFITLVTALLQFLSTINFENGTGGDVPWFTFIIGALLIVACIVTHFYPIHFHW